MKDQGQLPFVFLNAAMTADGKLAPADGRYVPFGSPRDRRLMMELRATADAVMAGARTVDRYPANLGPGAAKYRRLRVKNGLSEHNLRIIVSGSGTVDPRAEIFKQRFSPIIVLTSGRAAESRLRRLRSAADEVMVFGAEELDFPAALRWLRKRWNVRRLLCEGGGQLNDALLRAGVVDEIYLTVCPLVLAGRQSPTLADGVGVGRLADARRFKMVSMKRAGDEMFLRYRRLGLERVPAVKDSASAF